ncbi:hypothetical protein BDAP_001358 [Binucleata daphniae]
MQNYVSVYILAAILIFSYSISLQKCICNPQKILKNSNFYCILVFITFPHRFYFLPFYLIAITNVCSYTVLHKKKFEKYALYVYAADLVQYQRQMYMFAYALEFFCVFFSFLLCLVGRTSFLTCGAFFYCVYFEYLNNKVMRDAIGKIRQCADQVFENTGMLNLYYTKARDFAINKFGIKETMKHKKTE